MPANQKPQVHGSDAGYQQHQRRKTPICEPCQRAHLAHNQYYKAMKNGYLMCARGLGWPLDVPGTAADD